MITLESLVQFIANTLLVGGYNGEIRIVIKDRQITGLSRNRHYNSLNEADIDVVD